MIPAIFGVNPTNKVQKKIDFRFVYNRKGKLNADGKALLQIEAYLNGQRKYFSTGIFLKPEEWNQSRSEVTGKPDRIAVNNDIGKLKQQLIDSEYELSREVQNYTLDDLKTRFEKPLFTSFIEFGLSQLNAQKNLSPATIQKQIRHINKLKEFAGKDVKFSDLKYSFVEKFMNYLFGEKKDVNTVHDYFKRIGKFANMAIKHGYLKENHFEEIRPTTVKRIRQIITDKEWMAIENLKFTTKEKHLERTRDLFLIQCYTGLRFSDASVLNRTHIYETTDGMELRMKSKKEGKDIKLPLHYVFPVKGRKFSKPEQLIKKYWRKDDLPFFIPDMYRDIKDQKSTEKDIHANLQVTNRQLKDIQAKAKVKTLLTNHVGRHFFASFLLDRIPITIIQELLQHSKIETTMIYAHVSNDRIKKNLKGIKNWHIL
ncbi:MAG: site-specific integrase [Bacteroidota bacterium]